MANSKNKSGAKASGPAKKKQAPKQTKKQNDKEWLEEELKKFVQSVTKL